MKRLTALAVARAGAALGLALDLVEADDTIPDTPARAKLLELRAVAGKLQDVPIPPEPGGLQPGPSARTSCDSCGRVRIISGLSPRACPYCGQVSTATAM